MEVKTIYMDLVEGVKKGNGVWKLECEAFKKPIEIKIGYDNQELNQFTNQINELQVGLNNKDSKIYNLECELGASKKVIKDLQNEISEHKKEHQIRNGAMYKLGEEINELYKDIANLKTAVETLSGAILHQQETTKLIQQKITKQPMVFSDKTFISGHERCGLGMLEIPGGTYLVISKHVVGEHNEYVENQDDILFEKVTVDGPYVPFYQLVGGTELDNPTATIYRDLVFIPC